MNTYFLLYDSFSGYELVFPAFVLRKTNLVTVGLEKGPITSEEKLKFMPDIVIDDLDVDKENEELEKGVKLLEPFKKMGGKTSRDVFMKTSDFNRKFNKQQQEMLLGYLSKAPQPQTDEWMRFRAGVKKAPMPVKTGGFVGGLKGIAGSIMKIAGPLMAIAGVMAFFALFGETIQDYFIEPLMDFVDETIMERLNEALATLLTTFAQLITDNPAIIGAIVTIVEAMAQLITWINGVINAFTEAPATISFFINAASGIASIINGVASALTVLAQGITIVLQGWLALAHAIALLNPFASIETSANSALDAYNTMNAGITGTPALTTTTPVLPTITGPGAPATNVNVDVTVENEIELYGDKYEGGEPQNVEIINPVTRTIVSYF